MNISSLNGTNNGTSFIVLALDLAREIVIDYGTRVVSIIGIFVNLLGLLVLRNKDLEEKFYDCLYWRCFCNLVVCMFGSLHSQFPIYVLWNVTATFFGYFFRCIFTIRGLELPGRSVYHWWPQWSVISCSYSIDLSYSWTKGPMCSSLFQKR